MKSPDDLRKMSTIVQDYKNQGQKDERNFISVRVFSKKFKDDISHFSLQRQALSGNMPLCPSVYKTHLPTVVPAKPLVRLTGPVQKGSLAKIPEKFKKGDPNMQKKKPKGCDCILF